MVEFPKTLLVTSTGLVGNNLYSVIKKKKYRIAETFYPVYDQPAGLPVDITDPGSLEKVFLLEKPKVVILNAALSNVELCEEQPQLAKKINIDGTSNVAVLCHKYGSKLVFFSSDYIFDGKNGPYSEADIAHPVCYYGLTKLEGENLINAMLKDFLIIRTTIVYGYEAFRKNFCYRFINTLKSGQTINVPKDQIGSPTYAYNLAEVVIELIEKAKRGVYNVVGLDLMDRYEFSLKICEAFGLNKNLVLPVTTEELRQKARRPLLAGLKTDKVKAEVETEILGVNQGLELFKRELEWKN